MKARLIVLLLSGFALATSALAISSEEATKAVTAAYEDILGRKPDEEGLRHHRSLMVDKGWSEKDIRKKLKGSSEARSEDVDGIITRAYQDILGRNPDKDGLKTYRSKMLNDGWDEKKLRETLRKSKEAKN